MANSPYMLAFQYWEQLGYLAAKESYNYDDAIPAYKLQTGRERLLQDAYELARGDALDKIKRMRNRTIVRRNIRLAEGTMEVDKMTYHSNFSRDSLAVYTTNEYLILGFRGTDPCDPVRFMNWIPTSTGSKGKNIGFENECKKLFLERLPKASKSPKLLADVKRFNWGSPEMNELMTRFGYTINESAQYFTESCPDACSSFCNVTKSKETIQGEVCAKYANFRYSSPDSSKQGEFWNIYQYVDDKLAGGENRAQANSDCYSDRQITLASISEEPFAILSRDEKHRQTSRWALRAIENLAGNRPVIFAGHSLGGSLAFFAYYKALQQFHDAQEPKSKKKAPEYYYVGFNPASIGNYDGLLTGLRRYDKNWQQKSIIHRIDTDLVSVKTGSIVPIATYGQKPAGASTHPSVHGLYTFLSCEYQMNVEQTSRLVFGAYLRRLYSLSRSKSAKTVSKNVSS